MTRFPEETKDVILKGSSGVYIEEGKFYVNGDDGVPAEIDAPVEMQEAVLERATIQTNSVFFSQDELKEFPKIVKDQILGGASGVYMENGKYFVRNADGSASVLDLPDDIKDFISYRIREESGGVFFYEKELSSMPPDVQEQNKSNF